MKNPVILPALLALILTAPLLAEETTAYLDLGKGSVTLSPAGVSGFDSEGNAVTGVYNYYSLSGVTDTNTVTVSGGAHTVKIASDLTIDLPGRQGPSPFSIGGKAVLIMEIDSAARATFLAAATNRPAIEVKAGSRFTLQGNGYLTAAAGPFTAAIGGGGTNVWGNIELFGCHLAVATETYEVACIGGGMFGKGGSVMITTACIEHLRPTTECLVGASATAMYAPVTITGGIINGLVRVPLSTSKTALHRAQLNYAAYAMPKDGPVSGRIVRNSSSLHDYNWPKRNAHVESFLSIYLPDGDYKVTMGDYVYDFTIAGEDVVADPTPSFKIVKFSKFSAKMTMKGELSPEYLAQVSRDGAYRYYNEYGQRLGGPFTLYQRGRNLAFRDGARQIKFYTGRNIFVCKCRGFESGIGVEAPAQKFSLLIKATLETFLEAGKPYSLSFFPQVIDRTDLSVERNGKYLVGFGRTRGVDHTLKINSRGGYTGTAQTSEPLLSIIKEK